MCGIAGILRFDGRPVEPLELSGMLDRLAHRGQDHCDMVLGSSGPLSRKADIALGHRRLSIIDLSDHASQPMAYQDGRLWLTFNGEIYNYLELREELRACGYRFRTDSDTEVILAAYSKWGDACVERLNGMFAFALWDEERERLFCARDHLGIKPFYYFQTRGFIAFASESKALQQFHANALDPDALASYLLGLYVPAGWSIFNGVAKLLPGHVMIVEPSGRIEQRRYWRISQVADREDTPATRQALEERLKCAVARQLRSDVPVGALLSGGVDSGMVVALATAQGAQLHTYSIGFEGQAVSELPAAAEIAQSCKTVHHAALISARESIGYLDTSLAHLSEPIADPAIVPSYLLSAMAAADGVKVLLSGTGGDEIFGGYERYAGNANFRRRLLTCAPEWMRMAAGRMLPAHSKLGARLRNTSFDMLFNTGGDFGLCAALQGDDRRLGAFLDRLANAIPEPAAADRLPLLYKQMGFDMNVYLPDEILLLFDQMTMAHTIEGRVPLLDVDVVEAAFRFPPGSHASNHKTKRLFREIAAGYLGTSHVWRKKQGFAGPVPWWVRENLKLFRDVAMSTRDIPGLQAVAPELLNLCKGNAAPTHREANAMFTLYCLRRWYDRLE
jgi:asparagine synthase (glutamine-hydrolysing)